MYSSSYLKWKWMGKTRNSILITYLHQKSFYIMNCSTKTFHLTPQAICNKLTISFDFYFYSFVPSSRTVSSSELHFSIFIFKLSPITRQWNFLFLPSNAVANGIHEWHSSAKARFFYSLFVRHFMCGCCGISSFFHLPPFGLFNFSLKFIAFNWNAR